MKTKKYKILAIFLFVILLSGFFVNFAKNQSNVSQAKNNKKSTRKNDIALLKNIFPDTYKFIRENGPPNYFLIVKKDKKNSRLYIDGYAYFTENFAPGINGFSGPINMAVGISPEGRIKKIHVIYQNETPGYISDFNPLLNQFIDKHIATPFSLNNIDGITHATITSTAIIKTIDVSTKSLAQILKKAKSDYLALPKKETDLLPIIIPTLIFIIAIAGVFNGNVFFRWASLILSLIYLGIIKATMFSTISILNIILNRIPQFLNAPLWFLLTGFTAATLLLFGNIYCSSVCPFASLEELLFNTKNRFSHQKEKFTPKNEKKIRLTKYIILFILLIICLILGTSDIATVEVFILLFSGNTNIIGWLLIAIMLTASVFHFRFWCRYLCPAGAFNGLISQFSLYKIRLNKNHCSKCKACSEVCPVNAIELNQVNQPEIDYTECILCNKCTRACPTSALNFK